VNDLPSNWKETLDRCNFRLAAREIANFFQISDRMAKTERGEFLYKKEFISSWGKFAANPCHETAIQFLEDAPGYESFVLHYFTGCCPGGQFYRRGTRTAAEFPLGDYRLDMRLEDINGLKELTLQEYAVFGRDSLQEVVYHVSPTEFVGHSWNMMVGTIEGKIYQLGASLAFSAEKETTKLIKNVYECCELYLGTPTEEEQGSYIWDTDAGKVIFLFAVIQETNTFTANIYVGDRGDQRYGNS
jgi:hypothetical protein